MTSKNVARYSLKTRITLATLVVVVASFWALAFYVSHYLKQDTQRLLAEQQFSTVSLLAAQVNRDLSDRVTALEMASSQITPAMVRNMKLLQSHLETRPVLHSLFSGGVIAYGPDGTAIAEVPRDAGRVGTNYLDVDTVATALKRGKSNIGQPVMGKKLKAPVFGITVPIRDLQGNVIGALAGVVNLGKPNFLDQIAGSRYGKTGGYLIISKQARVIITATNKRRIMEPLPPMGSYSVIERFVQGYEGSEIWVNPLGEEVLQSVKGIPVADWYLGVALPTLEAFAPYRAMQNNMLLVTIFMTLLAGALTWWILSRQLAPLVATAEMLAKRAKDSHLPEPVPINRQDEIGHLMGGFNRLLEEVDQREKIMRISEVRYRTLFEATADAVLIVDARAIIDCNAATLKVFGARSREEIIGHHPGELSPPLQPGGESSDELAKRQIAIALDKGSQSFEWLHKRLDTNEPFSAEVLLSSFEIEGRTLVQGTVRDITERKAAQLELRASMERYQAVTQSANDAIITIDSSSNIVGWNSASEGLFGYTESEATGQTLGMILPQRFHTRHEEGIRRRMADGKPPLHGRSVEVFGRRKDGSEFPLELSVATWKTDQGQFFTGILRDISERKRTEDELALHRERLEDLVAERTAKLAQTEILKDQAFDLARAGHWHMNFNESSEYYISSPRIVEIIGDPPRDDFRYHIMNDWYPNIAAVDKGAADASLANFLAAVEGRVPRYDTFHPYKRPSDGNIVWVHVIGELIRDEQGQPMHLYGVVMDVTPMKQTEDELRLAKEAAEAANEAKDAFLANMSHELRTPLSAVIGMANLAQAHSTDPKLSDYLNKIATSGKHLNRIINELLDLSKIAAGHMELEIISFSLRQLIEHVNSVMVPRAAEKGLKVVTSIDDKVPDVLLGDPTRVAQIFLNLLGNAIKFTREGRVEIRVRQHALETSRVGLDIEFEDTGIGMRSEDLKQLFQPFTQADASVSRKYGGTGLGLTISRRLAEMMDGDISVTSREGIGTTFKVRIWLGLGNAADVQTVETVANQSLPLRYQGVRILVADDQPLNREIVQALLAAVGITPGMAENGQEVLDILAESGPQAFDLILMDVQMPIMDGLTATRALRSQKGFESLPIIAMTAHTMAHEQELNAAAGMNDHIGKPFDNPSFYRTLAKWLPKEKQIAPVASAETPKVSAFVGLTGSNLYALRGLDVKAGLARFNGNEERYRHWLTDFVVTAPAIFGDIQKAITAGLADNAHKTAHAFKGRVGMLGMTDLHNLVSALESALREGATTSELISSLDSTIEDMCDQLTRALSGVK